MKMEAMGNTNTRPTTVRPRTTKLIETMLAQRKHMLVLFWELTKLRTAQAQEAITPADLLEEFLEVLVDYIAAGHFGLYARIAEGTERRKPVVETAREIYPDIASTTDMAVAFSEKYEKLAAENGDAAVAGDDFARDLSLLGESITARIEFEDRLILAMLGEEFPLPSLRA